MSLIGRKQKKNTINLPNCVVGWRNKNVSKFNLKKKTA